MVYSGLNYSRLPPSCSVRRHQAHRVSGTSPLWVSFIRNCGTHKHRQLWSNKKSNIAAFHDHKPEEEAVVCLAADESSSKNENEQNN